MTVPRGWWIPPKSFDTEERQTLIPLLYRPMEMSLSCSHAAPGVLYWERLFSAASNVVSDQAQRLWTPRCGKKFLQMNQSIFYRTLRGKIHSQLTAKVRNRRSLLSVRLIRMKLHQLLEMVMTTWKRRTVRKMGTSLWKLNAKTGIFKSEIF